VDIKKLITEFSKTKPEADIIIGYGSEVKRQANDRGMDRQVDLILGVQDSMLWHELNHEMNPTDYDSNLGYKLLPAYKNLGTKINYLSHLPFENYTFKIGVVNTEDLIYDLICWKNFFLAGRLQKPVEIVKTSFELDYALRRNRMNALKIALLLLNKQEASLEELFYMICSLSYVGDLRRTMHVETKHKIQNIVIGSFEELKKIYKQLNAGYYKIDVENRIIIDYVKLISDLDTLPEPLRSKIINQLTGNKTDIDFSQIIWPHFRNTNLKTSIAQPLKGCALNGFPKTLTYFQQKISKK